MNKAEMIEIIKICDEAVRDQSKAPLSRVTFSRLKDLHFSTVKRVHNWYGKLVNTDEWKAFREIQSENPDSYWKNAKRDGHLPEVKKYRAAKFAFQKMFKATLPKEITRDIKSKARPDDQTSNN